MRCAQLASAAIVITLDGHVVGTYRGRYPFGGLTPGCLPTASGELEPERLTAVAAPAAATTTAASAASHHSRRRRDLPVVVTGLDGGGSAAST
jgi:hypothetical protein